MTQKMKVIIGLVAFAVIIVGASVAYNVLSKNAEVRNDIVLEENKLEETEGKDETVVDTAVDADTTVDEGRGDIELEEEEGTVEENSTNLRKAPDFAMEDHEGNSVKLSDMIANGKPIVLNFWASWCPPCKSEMPDFDAVYKELGEEVQFMMINMTDGQRETVEIGTQYIEEQGFSFPIFFDVNQEGALNYQIYSIPTTVFIDKDGHAVTGAQGAIDEETLRKGIDMIR